MDLPTKTIDTEKEIPPKSKSNGSLNHHYLSPALVSAPATLTLSSSALFKECLKNHAASIGGHAIDGCGEFLPSPNSDPTEPTSLTCAACGCHRNFHRREPENSTTLLPLEFHRRRSSSSPPPLPAPHMLMALRTSPPETLNLHQLHPYSGRFAGAGGVTSPATPSGFKTENSSGRKRFRTKFSQDQKDKMLELAEKLEWKMQKNDDVLIENLCNEIGIRRGVYKVWLHNNKSTLGKREVMIIHNNNKNEFNGGDQSMIQHQRQIEISGDDHVNGHPHVNINAGSSSSS